MAEDLKIDIDYHLDLEIAEIVAHVTDLLRELLGMKRESLMVREELRLLDLLKVLTTLTKFVDLKNVDLGDLLAAVKPLLDNEPPLDSAENVGKRLDEVLVAVKALSKITKTTVDDNLVALLDKFLGNPEVKALIAQVLWRFLGNAKLREELNLGEIDWAKLIQLILLIIEFLNKVFNKPKT